MKEQEDSLERTDQEDDKITNKVEQWKETMTTTITILKIVLIMT